MRQISAPSHSFTQPFKSNLLSGIAARLPLLEHFVFSLCMHVSQINLLASAKFYANFVRRQFLATVKSI